MLTNINIPLSLFSTFHDITFDDPTHTYTHRGKKLKSVTTVLHDYIDPFDKHKWLPIKSEQYGITEEQLDGVWTFQNDHSKFKGSAVHNYIENYYFNKSFRYPKEEIVDFFGYDPIYKSYDHIIKNQFTKFAELTKGKLIPVKPEMIVYDLDYMISGMVDMIFYNVKEGKYQVWDWKTNKALKYENRWQSFKDPLGHVQECEFNTYSLQLHLYKHILEKNTGIKFCNDCYIVWFFEKNKSYEIIKTRDMSFEIELLLAHHTKNKAMLN